METQSTENESVMLCPRRAECGFSRPGHDTWREDDTCSYCGSLNPETFMARIRAGDVELTPTDKNYKVYVNNKGGVQFRQTYRNCSGKDCKEGPDACTHWVTREMSGTKFYFQHLSAQQQIEFVDLLNAKKLILGYPERFYVLPFFIKVN